jgi:hypothetical protein
MRVAVDEVLHVFRSESELADVVSDHWRSLDKSAVQEDVSLRAGNQERRDITGPDVIDVPDNAKWLDRLVPGAPLRIGLAEQADGKQKGHNAKSGLHSGREKIGELKECTGRTVD